MLRSKMESAVKELHAEGRLPFKLHRPREQQSGEAQRLGAGASKEGVNAGLREARILRMGT